MNRRLILFGLASLVPVAVLAALFPERALPSHAPSEAYVSTADADIVAFVREGCPHCAAFEAYATEHEWAVRYLDVEEAEAQSLFARLQERAPALHQGVPTIVVNGTVSQGYDTDADGAAIARRYEACRAADDACMDLETFLASTATVDVLAGGGTCNETEACAPDDEKFMIDVWLLGTVDVSLLSLPVLSILLGFLDGFNPCAMWVLITLLTLLINTHDMRKVWVIGGTFLFVSGAVYYFFIAAWLNVFLLIGFNAWIQKIIGLVAVLGGGFYLYEACGKDPNQCHVTGGTSRHKIIGRMKTVMQYSAWPAMIGGVAILAISVNMIELVCTAGLPAIFTQILAFNNVSTWARYGYMALYILLYMIDDIVIFGIAIYTLHATGLTAKYRRFTLIFGGGLMYALGILLLYWPEALTV